MSDPVEGEIVNQKPPLVLTKQDPNIVMALETAFNNGYNITEACHYAGISRETYYTWLRDDDGFSYRMSIAQTALNRKAKANIMTAINEGDPNISLRYLTLRDPDFKPKSTLEIDPNEEVIEQRLKEFMDDTNDGAYPDTFGTNAVSTEPTATDESQGGADVAQSS